MTKKQLEGENQTALQTKKKIKIFSWKNFNYCICLMSIASFMGYLACVNNLSVKGFELKEARAKYNVLEEENTKMELSVMEMEAYQNLEEKVADSGMVKADNVEYISSISDMVAKR